MKIKAIIIILFLFAVLNQMFCITDNKDYNEKEIKKVVQTAYIGGVFNDATTDAMIEGFHKRFTMQFIQDDSLVVTTLQQWKSSLDKWKEKRKNWKNVEGEINILAIENETAIVRVDVYQENKVLYTDFLSLYHFSTGWEITNKIYTVRN